ncbi:gliding motility lipoprotein GldH [Polaribacter irgensii]|nr:gliding motility lipoprotein GldH [Polaribacter irgensii]
MEAIQKNKWLVFFLISSLMISCGDHSEFNEYKTLENSAWKTEDRLVFSFKVKDTIVPKDLFINIRNNSAYEFSNLFLITALKRPDNSVVIDTLQYEMADALGKFLGAGFSEVKENKLFYKEHNIFPLLGTYSLEIRHAMRRNGNVYAMEFLKGVQEVGFSIEKINE